MSSNAALAGAPANPETLAARRTRKWGRTAAIALAVTAVLAVAAYQLKLSPVELLLAGPALGEFVVNAWPPDFSDPLGLAESALFTLLMAVIGTLLATVVSAPLAILASRNIAPSGAVFVVTRFVVLVCRAIPDFVIALIFVAAIGLGPAPGVLGLAIHSVGMLGKLFAERIEEVDPGPLEALAAMGARRSQVIRIAVLPQVVPSVVANTLYRLDINIRSSIVLGLVGAGGIGYELITALQALEYGRAFAVIIVVLVLVAAVEAASNRLRRRFL